MLDDICKDMRYVNCNEECFDKVCGAKKKIKPGVVVCGFCNAVDLEHYAKRKVLFLRMLEIQFDGGKKMSSSPEIISSFAGLLMRNKYDYCRICTLGQYATCEYFEPQTEDCHAWCTAHNKCLRELTLRVYISRGSSK